MKKMMVALMLAFLCFVTACAERKTISGVTYDVYGLADQAEKQNPDVQYEIVWGNVVWGVILFETIIAPIYFFGFALYEPVGLKSGAKGAVPSQ